MEGQPKILGDIPWIIATDDTAQQREPLQVVRDRSPEVVAERLLEQPPLDLGHKVGGINRLLGWLVRGMMRWRNWLLRPQVALGSPQDHHGPSEKPLGRMHLIEFCQNPGYRFLGHIIGINGCFAPTHRQAKKHQPEFIGGTFLTITDTSVDAGAVDALEGRTQGTFCVCRHGCLGQHLRQERFLVKDKLPLVAIRELTPDGASKIAPGCFHDALSSTVTNQHGSYHSREDRANDRKQAIRVILWGKKRKSLVWHAAAEP